MKKSEKIRDWIIHKLGGHTHLEYELIEKRMYIPAKYIEVRHDVHTFNAKMIINRKEYYIPEEVYRRELATLLTDQLLKDGMIKFLVKDPKDPDENVEIKATLKVVHPNGVVS